MVPENRISLIIVGKEPTVLAAGAGGACLDIFLSQLSILFLLSLSHGHGPMYAKILSQRDI